jgi:hypothetical protein
MIESLVAALEPWQTLFADSLVVSTTIVAVHILSLLIGGGLAIAADRMTLRALRNPQADWQYHMQEIGAVHRPVGIALMGSFLSGLLLAAADIEEFIDSPVYWTKMALVAMLIVNGFFLHRVSRERSALTARISLVLWISIATLGVVLGNT